MRAFSILLVATLAWGVLSFGAVYPWAYFPLGVAAAALGVWGIVVTRAWRDSRVRVLSGALALVAAIGLIPLHFYYCSLAAPQTKGGGAP